MDIENMKKSYFDIVIIGANISGMLMALRLEEKDSKMKCAVFESETILQKLENADKIPFYINTPVDIPNINWDSENIITEIWDNNCFGSKPNEMQKNIYAKKITSRYCKTTLDNIVYKKKIFVPTNNKIEGRQKILLSSIYNNLKNTNITFNRKIISISMEKQEIVDSTGLTIKYKYLISTIPLPQLINILNIKMDYNLPCIVKPFYISVINVNFEKKYHVIYCVDKKVRINRIAYLGKKIYIESPEKFSSDSLNKTEKMFIQQIINKFGLLDIELSFNLEQAIYPRFVENEVEDTNKFIRFMEANNIFLLGRYANWKFMLTENVWNKTKEILEYMEE